MELSDRAFTVEDVVKFSKDQIQVDEICKTIILKGKKSKQKFGVLLRGNDRVDFSKAKEVFGEHVRIADREDVMTVAGVEPGAVCPLALQVDLFVDQRVLNLERINVSSGDHLIGLIVAARDLNKLVDYKTIDVAD